MEQPKLLHDKDDENQSKQLSNERNVLKRKSYMISDSAKQNNNRHHHDSDSNDNNNEREKNSKSIHCDDRTKRKNSTTNKKKYKTKKKKKKKHSKHKRSSRSRNKKKHKKHRSSSDTTSSSSSHSDSTDHSSSSSDKDDNHSSIRSDDSDSDVDSSSSTSRDSRHRSRLRTTKKTAVVLNRRLLAKLAARGETLEERKARRSQLRAARIQATLGYTPDDNPFNDPNLHETFTWKKKKEHSNNNNNNNNNNNTNPNNKSNTFEEIEKVRQRRKDREQQFEEMERIRAEEARMKELENYDEWARKEEQFHLQQQRQRSAIRLIEGRERPIDVLAKNILLFGLSNDNNNAGGAVKYHEKYSVLEAIEDLEAELEEPHVLLTKLKLSELEELLLEIISFQNLEREASVQGQDSNHIILRYWDNLRIVTEDEIKFLKSGGKNGKHARMVADIQNIFEGCQSVTDLLKMNDEIAERLRLHALDPAAASTKFGGPNDFNRDYWIFVKQQLLVFLAKIELSDLHSKMLVCQLEKLEMKKEQLQQIQPGTMDAFQHSTTDDALSKDQNNNNDYRHNQQQQQQDPELWNNNNNNNNNTSIHNNNSNSGNTNDFDLGDLEEELGLASEVDPDGGLLQKYSWQDKYRPRKPRYFNRVKTGYDWNKYNQTHYDKDNPPPKTVQGYKFNIFYPDLIDPTKTPQFRLEPTNSDDFCIIRFMAGPPYEDIAFKIVNREWNRSRKRGFKSTFERGVLSLYFNFTTHWYRK